MMPVDLSHLKNVLRNALGPANYIDPNGAPSGGGSPGPNGGPGGGYGGNGSYIGGGQVYSGGVSGPGAGGGGGAGGNYGRGKSYNYFKISKSIFINGSFYEVPMIFHINQFSWHKIERRLIATHQTLINQDVTPMMLMEEDKFGVEGRTRNAIFQFETKSYEGRWFISYDEKIRLLIVI